MVFVLVRSPIWTWTAVSRPAYMCQHTCARTRRQGKQIMKLSWPINIVDSNTCWEERCSSGSGSCNRGWFIAMDWRLYSATSFKISIPRLVFNLIDDRKQTMACHVALDGWLVGWSIVKFSLCCLWSSFGLLGFFSFLLDKSSNGFAFPSPCWRCWSSFVTNWQTKAFLGS